MHTMQGLRARSIMLTIGAALFIAASSAHAAFDTSWLSLHFTTPTGTAKATDDLDVEVTVSLSADATEGLAFDSNAGFPWGLGDLLPTTGWSLDTSERVEFASYDWAGLSSAGLSCTDLASCALFPAYDFVWGDMASIASTLILDPGESVTYRLGHLTPVLGAAPAGIYTISSADLTFSVWGQDANGNLVYEDVLWLQTGDEYFSRVVTSVPEPGTWALMAVGLVACAARRRARR